MKARQRMLLITALAICVFVSAALTTGTQAHDAKTKPADPKLVTAGHTLFLTNCSPCHGADAQGDDGPNLHHLGLDDTTITWTVTNGIKDQMPPFGQKLKGNDLKAVVAYVHSLQ